MFFKYQGGGIFVNFWFSRVKKIAPGRGIVFLEGSLWESPSSCSLPLPTYAWLYRPWEADALVCAFVYFGEAPFPNGTSSSIPMAPASSPIRWKRELGCFFTVECVCVEGGILYSLQKNTYNSGVIGSKKYTFKGVGRYKKGGESQEDATFFQSIPQGALIDCSHTRGPEWRRGCFPPPLIALLAPFQGGWLAALGHGMVWPRWCFRIRKGIGRIGGTNKKMNIDANKNKTFSGLALLEFSQLDIRVKKITFFNYWNFRCMYTMTTTVSESDHFRNLFLFCSHPARKWRRTDRGKMQICAGDLVFKEISSSA